MEKLWEKLKLIPVLNVINFAYSYALHFYCILYLRIISWVAANQLRRTKVMVKYLKQVKLIREKQIGSVESIQNANE